MNLSLLIERRGLDGRREKSQTEVGSIFIYMQNASVSPCLLSTSEVGWRCSQEATKQNAAPLMHITNAAKEHGN